MKKTVTLFFVFGGIAFAGQSIQLSTAGVSNSSIAAQKAGSPWRVEFSIHGWDTTLARGGAIHINDAAAVGFVDVIYNGGGDIFLDMHSSVTGGLCGSSDMQIHGLQSMSPAFLTVRFQEDPATKSDYLQAWDINGKLVYSNFCSFAGPGGANGEGADVNGGGNGENLSTAYFRIYTSVVPTNARPPVTADTETSALVDWKFDGNLNDSSGHKYKASISDGRATYVPTSGQNLVVPVLKTMNAPAWGNFGSLRAGFPAQLDGASSYSQADASATVTCSWQALSGPTSLTWDNRSSCTPTVEGLIFGDYNFELMATDADGQTATATQHIGAVATDSNGVVVNADPNVDFLFGPMIALGKNPWGYEDYWTLHASTLRYQDYLSSGWAPVPQWEHTGQGATSYYFNCVGPIYFCNRSLGTALSAGIAASDTSIPVTTAANLDLTELPTRILLYDGTNFEEIRICSSSGNTLTACYDGRGQSPRPFGIGAGVVQSKVSGAGTKFLTDPTAPVCPVGAPGPPGPSSYSTGTVALTAGSATMTGTGATWTNANGVGVGYFVRVSATHSATPFYFVAQIAALGSATGITLNRAFPSDADTASGLSYSIMPANRTIDLRAPHPLDPSGDGELMFGTTGCESEDAVYLNPIAPGNSFSWGHDIPGLDGVHVTGRPYSVTDNNGWVNESSTGGINFYGEGLAHRALYYRSGLASALAAANAIDDYWIKSPWGNPDGNGYPKLFLGGGGVGAFADAILGGRVSWSDLRGYAAMGEFMVNGVASVGCNSYDDTRDLGWAYSWLILAAIFDPDTGTFGPRWRKDLAAMQTNDNNCKRADNSWANGFYFNKNIGPVTLTNGSATATGANLPKEVCAGVATGAGTVANGSGSFTVSGGMLPANSSATTLVITGTRGGQTFVGSYVYKYNSASSGTLGVLWPGDSGSVTWMAVNVSALGANDLTAFATGSDDLSDLQKNWACIWNSSSQITLNRPWDGATGSGYYVYPSNLAGYGQQPFMLGIKTLSMNYLAKQTVPALASYVSPYTALSKQAAQWIHDNGYDPNNQGINYGRVFPFCEPATTANGVGDARTPGCNYGTSPGAIVAARELNAEVGTAAGLFYDYNPSRANKTWADTVYGSLWGYCSWTIGVYCDGASPAANPAVGNLTDGYIHAGKWFGFFAGAAMSHRWPAERLGGVQPPRPRRIRIAFDLGAVPSAAKAQIVVTAPSGAHTTFACASSPCEVTVDDRQGTHVYEIQYLSTSGEILSPSQSALLR